MLPTASPFGATDDFDIDVEMISSPAPTAFPTNYQASTAADMDELTFVTPSTQRPTTSPPSIAPIGRSHSPTARRVISQPTVQPISSSSSVPSSFPTALAPYPSRLTPSPSTPSPSASAATQSTGSSPILLLLSTANITLAKDKLVIRGLISTPSNAVGGRRLKENEVATGHVNASWSLVDGKFVEGRQLHELARTTLHISEPAFRDSMNHHLVMPANSLISGHEYTFVLDAWTHGSSARAHVDIQVRTSPHSGWLFVDPRAGVAYFDMFDLRAPDWESDEPPLQYEFWTGPSATSDADAVLRAANNISVALESRLPAGLPNLTLTVVVTDVLGAEGTASATAQVVGDSEKSGAEFNALLTDALWDAYEGDSFDDVSQAAISAALYVQNDTVMLESLVRIVNMSFEMLVDTLSISELTQTVSTLLYLVDDPVALPLEVAETALDVISEVCAHIEMVGLGSSSSTLPTSILEVISNILQSPLFSTAANNTDAAHTLLDAIDSITAAQRDTLVYNEQFVETSAEFVRTVSQRTSPHHDLVFEVATQTMNASVSIAASHDVQYDVSLTEFTINPFNTIPGSVSTSDTLQLYFTATDEYDIDLQNGDTTVTLDILGGDIVRLDNATLSNQTVIATCECGFVGFETVMCPDGILNRTFFCDGTPSTVEMSCNTSLPACATWSDGRWFVPDYCKIINAENDGVATCECTINNSQNSSQFSTIDEQSGTTARYNVVFESKPTLRSSVLLLISTTVILGFTLFWAGLGEVLDIRDKRVESMGVESMGFALRATMHGSFFSQQESRLKDALISRHPCLNMLLVYSEHQSSNHVVTVTFFDSMYSQIPRFHKASFCTGKCVPRRLRAWKFGMELLVIFVTIGLQIVLEYPMEDCGKHDESMCNQVKSLTSRRNLCQWDECSGSCVNTQSREILFFFVDAPNSCVDIVFSKVDYNVGRGVAVASDHVIMVFLMQPLVVLFLAIGNWLMDDYLLAPVPTALRCMWSNGTVLPRRQSSNAATATPKSSWIETAETKEPGACEYYDDDGDGKKGEVGTTCRMAYEKESSLPCTAVQGWIDVISESVSSGSTTWSFGSNRTSESSGEEIGLSSSLPHPAERASRSAAAKLVKHAAKTGQPSRKRRPSSKKNTLNYSQRGFMGAPGLVSESSLIQELARRVQHAVYLRGQELQDIMGLGSWNDRAGQQSLRILVAMEADLFDSWGWVACTSKWEAIIAKIITGHLRAAVKLYDELDSDKYSDHYRMMKVTEHERFDRLAPVERKVYAKTEDRALYPIKAREDPPPVWAYLVAWCVCILFLAGVCMFTARVAAVITVDRAKLVLVAFCVVVAFYFGLILPIEIVFFDSFLPALLQEHLEHLKHPSELRRFPYRTPLPDSAACYLALMFPWLAETTLGQVLLRGKHVGVDPRTSSLSSMLPTCSLDNPGLEDDPQVILGKLSEIYRDSVFKPPPGTRFGLFLSSIILAAPTKYQEFIVEELTVGVVVLCAVIATRGEFLNSINLSRRKINSTSEVINYIVVAILSIVLGLLVTIIIKLLNTRPLRVLIDSKHHKRIAPSKHIDRRQSSSKSLDKVISVNATDVEENFVKEQPELLYDSEENVNEIRLSEVSRNTEDDYNELVEKESEYLARVLDDCEMPSSDRDGNLQIEFDADGDYDLSLPGHDTLLVEFENESLGSSTQVTPLAHTSTLGEQWSSASTTLVHPSSPSSMWSSASTALVHPTANDQVTTSTPSGSEQPSVVLIHPWG